MEKSMELLLSKLDSKLQQQAETITKAVTANVLEALETKLQSLQKDNESMKQKIKHLEHKNNILEQEKRKHNLVFFGVEEIGKTETELVDYIKDIIIDTEVPLESNEISNVYRIGKRVNNKNRPVVVSLTTLWKKHLILKKKSKLNPGIYVKEDYTKEILEQRRQLQPKVDEEKKKGNIAYIKHDKVMVITPKENNREKRKRENSRSPNASNQKKATATNNHETQSSNKTNTNIIKPNILNYIERGRSASVSELSKNL